MFCEPQSLVAFDADGGDGNGDGVVDVADDETMWAWRLTEHLTYILTLMVLLWQLKMYLHVIAKSNEDMARIELALLTVDLTA